MKNFARALREAWRHWPALLGAICCSLGVAALWGVNIAALGPIIETTLNGKSLQEWNSARIERAAEDLEALRAELVAATAERDAAGDEAARDAAAVRVQMIQTKSRLAEKSREASEWLQPHLERWLPAKPFHTVVMIVGFVVVATALKQVLAVTNTMLVSLVSQGTARELRGRVFDNALELDRPGFNSQGISGFVAHITYTTDMLAAGITNFYGGAITEPLRVLSCLCVAWWISWRLTLASLIFAPLAAFLMLGLNRRIRALSTRTLDRSLGFHHVMLDVFHGLVTVQAYTMERFERERFGDAAEKLKRTALLATFYNAMTSPLTELLGMGILCTGLVVSSFLVLHRETTFLGIPLSDAPLSVPAVTVFFGALIGAADPLRKLSGVLTGINTGMAAANILYPVLDLKSRLVESANPVPLPRKIARIEFRGVVFSYDGAHNVLHGLDLVIPAGERLAIIGPNGGGKSTLINLLCRFYDPREGQVLIDGVSLREVRLGDLRSRIALVTQQTELFNETILHNIRYGRWDATDAEVIDAARRARAHEFIEGFPEGYQTIVGPNGQRLSGGQRQRVALARAILRNAEVLVLDEATSQVDVDSERLIHDALADYGQGRTLVMITHRESTLSLATRIVRIDHGTLTEVSSSDARAA
jgi:ATP-binding cassette subfamily B protein/subfamily B ATP-binding cassette protein MsbA